MAIVEEDPCVICWCDYDENLIQVKLKSCRHSVCETCYESLKTIGRHVCPMCRKEFVPYLIDGSVFNQYSDAMKSKIFKVKFNGGATHIATFDNHEITVWDDDDDDDGDWVLTKKIKCYSILPDSGAILVQLDGFQNRYVHISNNVLTFETEFQMIRHSETIGPNACPYIECRDTEGNVYLINEKVVIRQPDPTIIEEDMYDYYYRSLKFVDIVKDFIIDEVAYKLITDKIFVAKSLNETVKRYSFIYDPDPLYFCIRMKRRHGDDVKYYLTKADDSSAFVEITEKDICKIMEDHGNLHGFSAMKMVV